MLRLLFFPGADIFVFYNISELLFGKTARRGKTVCTCFKDIVFGYM